MYKVHPDWRSEWQTIICGSCQKCHFCHDETRLCRNKTHLLSWQKYACHNKSMLAATKYISHNKHLFVTTNLFLSWQNTSFVMNNMCLLWQKQARHNKIVFVTTKLLSRKMFVVTSTFLSRQKYFVTTNTCLLQQKLYLWQLPPVITDSATVDKTHMDLNGSTTFATRYPSFSGRGVGPEKDHVLKI